MTKKQVKVDSEKTETKIELSEAEKIWEEIKDVQLNMFALPDQTVQKYCKFVKVEPTRAYLALTNLASSVLVALEDALGKKFTIVSANQFIIFSRKNGAV